MISLVMTGRMTPNGREEGRLHGHHQRYDDMAQGPSYSDGGSIGTTTGCDIGRWDHSVIGHGGRPVIQRPTAADRRYSWTHASRIGEASHPGPAQVTIAAVGTLQKVFRGVKAAISYPRPGTGSLRGAVAPGYVQEAHDAALDEGGRDAFALKIEATNPTGWRALQRRLLMTKAHVVMAQETWLTQDALPAASAWAKRRGWQSIWAAALPGPNGGASGGVAVFARDGIGLHLPPDGTHIWSPGRAVAAVVQAPGHRPTLVVSCYLCHGRGPCGENLEILAAVGQRLRAAAGRYEFVLGGDFNMEPPDLASTGIQDEVNATILAPDTARGTFRGSKAASLLDYFIVSNRMAAAVDRVGVIEAAGVRGHVPVLLEFKSKVTTLRALHLRKPPPLGTERVFGPISPPPEGGRARRAAEDALREARADGPNVQELLDIAYREWADNAEIELADYTACPPKKWGERGRLPNLVWRSVVPENVPGNHYPHAATAAWIGAMAKEVRRIGTEAGSGRQDQEGAHHDVGDDPSTTTDGDEDLTTVDREIARARGRKPPTSAAGCIRVLNELLASIDADMPECGEGEASEQLNTLRGRLRAAAEELRRGLIAIGAPCNDDDTSAAVAIPSMSTATEEVDGAGWDPTRGADAVEDRRNRQMDVLCADIEAVEVQYTTQMKTDEQRKWREWVSEGIDKGASRAHAYSRMPKAWTPTTALLADGTVSSSVDDLMNEQRDKFKRLWGPSDRPFKYSWKDDAELPTMRADHLRATANTFAERTSTTYDGLHPRHLGRLSDDSLDTLGIIFAAVERSGTWPRQVSLIIATLPSQASWRLPTDWTRSRDLPLVVQSSADHHRRLGAAQREVVLCGSQRKRPRRHPLAIGCKARGRHRKWRSCGHYI